jgi:hypothetical protein
MFNKSGIKYLLAVVLLCISLSASAQCAMCRAAVESEGNGVKKEAINDGIVYLMVIPYLLAGGIGFAVYRMYRGKKV